MFEFNVTDKTEYDTIAEIWNSAIEDNAFPTFSFSEVYSTLSAVPVVVEQSEYTPYRPTPTKGSFTLTLTQAGTY